MRGSLFVAISAVLMGTLPYFVKNISLNPFSITLIRLSLGLVFVSLFMVVFREKPRLNRELVTLGLINTGVVAFYIFAISTLYAALAALLLYMAPVYILLYKLFKGEISRSSVAIVLLGIFGLTLMLYPFGNLSVGVFFGFLSGLLYALLFVYIRKLRRNYSSLQITFSNLLVGTIVLLPFVTSIDSFQPIFVSLGLIPTAVPFVLLSYGMKFVREENASVIALVEPVVASSIGFFVFGEALSVRQLLGAIAVLVASGIAALNKEGEEDVSED